MFADREDQRKAQLRARALSFVVAVLGLVPGRAAAQGDTLTLAAALRIAREVNPMLRVARASATAAGQRIGPAGALPDPQLQFGLMNRLVADFGNTMDPMTMNQVQLMQMLPWPGKLGGAKRAARHTAAAARAEADEQERMLAITSTVLTLVVIPAMSYLWRAWQLRKGQRTR